MFRFQQIEMLYWLIAIPIFIIIYYVYNYQRKNNLKNFGDADLFKQLSPDASISKPTIKFYLSIIIILCTILALARPQFGFNKKEVKRNGIELMVALDVSNSMNARDLSGSNDFNSPSRLDIAKQIVSGVINNMKNDKIGLVIFAGDAYMQIPITADHISAKMFLSNISTNSISRQGTEIKKAIDLSMRSFGPESEKGRAILIITDGEDHQGDANGAAKAALEKGVNVFTLGLGSTVGSPIPIGVSKSFLKDKNGEVVITKINEQMLTQIAQAGGGAYIRGSNNSRSTVNTINDYLGKVDKKEMNSMIYENYEEYFQVIASIALLFMLIDLLILRGKSPLFKNLRLFK